MFKGEAEGRGQREESVVANKVGGGGKLRKLSSNEGGGHKNTTEP